MTGETSGGELGQVLQAVQGLGTRVDTLSQQVQQSVQGLSTRMDSMDTRMNKVEGWMERLGAEFIRSREELKTEMQLVRTELKGDIQQLRSELKGEIQKVRTDVRAEIQGEVSQLRTEMQAGFQQVHRRIDRTNDGMVLMGAELHSAAAERVQDLEKRVRALETREPQR